MFIANIIAIVLLIIGGLNWLIIGLSGYNLVSGFTGSDDNIVARVIYILVGASAIWLIISCIISGGMLSLMM
ncbi:MAG: DUF378 domain-containing protein [Clostridia bacterium]|nr:DUF378 domain-containing protein [Clostridia bacterium]